MNTATATVAKTATVQARVSPALKKSAVRVFRRHNLTLSQAINLFLQQAKARGDVSFRDFSAYTEPNEKTRKALRDSKAGRDVVYYDDVEDMIRDLHSD